MTVQDEVGQVLDKYRNNRMVLDAFWQWAKNPTSQTAGRALEENRRCIRDNLRLRYRLSDAEACEVTDILAKETKDWVNCRESEVIEVLRGQMGETLRERVRAGVPRRGKRRNSKGIYSGLSLTIQA